MGSMFDSIVYRKRQRAPYLVFDISRFLKAMSYNEQKFTSWGADFKGDEMEKVEPGLIKEERHSVSSGMWYTLKWIDEDGKPYSVDSQNLELLGWRAFTRHEMTKKEMLQFKHGRTKELQGLIYPDAEKCPRCFSAMYKNKSGNDPWCSNIYCPY